MSTRDLIELELDDLPDHLLSEVYDFICFLKADAETFNGILASEPVLVRDWDTTDEDKAWASL